MISFAVSGLIALIDQLTKAWALAFLADGRGVPLIPGALYMTLVRNTGAAFGIFRHKAALFIFISLIAVFIILLLVYRYRGRHAFVRWGLAFVLGGAVGNLIDRVRLGYVVDFIDIRIWPVFNVADCAISLGAFTLVCYVLFRAR